MAKELSRPPAPSICTAMALLAALMVLPTVTFAAPGTDVALTTVPEQTLAAPDLLTPAVPVPATTDLWGRIRNGYGIPDLRSPLVTSQLNWYGSHADFILRTSERASHYLYHVVEELEKRGMPTELALLPFIESAFNPQAMSSAKASGMWQFIPSTGKDFNLKQNMFQDERRGVLDSTDAALTYLQKLYDMFGDWQLALAAYNWGEGSVTRAIKKQQAAGLPTDFASMAYLMPKETQNYVPKLQAVKDIIGSPEQFKLELPHVDNQPYFATIDKTRDIDVRVAAQLAELSVSEFRELNPQFNRPVITGDDTKILLPADNVEIFKSNMSKWEGPLSSWTAYTVGKNERIESIARRLGVPSGVMKDVNQLPGNLTVKAGSTLLIPKTARSADNDISPMLADHAILAVAHDNTRRINVTVTRNDSLASIAKRYRVTPAQLRDWNTLRSDTLKAGQKLQVNVAAAPVRSVTRRTVVSRSTSKTTASANKGKKVVVAQSKTNKNPA